MKILRGRGEEASSGLRRGPFAGEVWGDPILADPSGVTVNNVFFAPGGRTHWHSHERGQLLIVTGGAGVVCAADGAQRPIGVGDMVWTEPGERHWHGAGDSSFLLHVAVSLGEISWGEAVLADGADDAGRGA